MPLDTDAPPAAPAADARARSMPSGVREGEIFSRRAGRPVSYDARTRTFEAVLSAGSPVRRWFGVETLSMDPANVDVSRVAQGQVRFLDAHNQWDRAAVLGVVESVRFDGSQMIGVIRLAETDAARDAEGQIARGELTGISIGYRAGQFRLVESDGSTETWEITRWELLEASLVSVPADPAAMVRSLAPVHPRASAHNPERTMPDNTPAAEGNAPANETPAAVATAPAAEPTRATPAPAADAIARDRQRSAEIMEIGQRAGLSDADVRTAIETGTTVEAFRARAFDALASRAASAPTSATIVRDERDTRRAHMRDAIAHRLAESAGARVDPSDGARRYMGMTLSEMAATALGDRSMPRTAADRLGVFERAFHSTSDFPIILSGAMNQRLLGVYQTAAPTYRMIARQTSFVDFRPHDQIRPGDFPMLQKVLENGEIKSGTFGEKREAASVASYGVIFNLSRQLLVNDQLGAIDQVLAGQGTTVALFEEMTFFALKAANGGAGPTLLEDAKAVFHADHGNLAGAGAVISTASLAAGRTAMRKQTRLDKTQMGLTPAILLVSPDKETEAELALAQVTPAQSSQINLFSGRLRPVVSAQLTGNAWELYTDLGVGHNWVWGLLDGFQGPRLRTDDKLGMQGVAVQLEHDFGVGAVDFRFGYRNPGA